MDLWIRSQDKMNLVKINQINVNYQDNRQIIANYIPDFIGNQGEYYDILGSYSSKERALEVLDDIQHYLLDGAFARMENGLGEVKNLIPNPIFVYGMPEE